MKNVENKKILNSILNNFIIFTVVVLIPFNGARFLASGGLDRAYKFWNLEDTSTPQNCMQKGIILDGAWMTHWPCAVISFDDALG